MPQKQIDWMSKGAELTANAGEQAAILAESARLEWHDLPCTDVPFCQGWALGHLIKNVVTGKPQAIAWNGVLCNRYSLIGILAQYTNGTYRHHWADIGTDLIPLFTERIEQ